jgi:hypothetical protein
MAAFIPVLTYDTCLPMIVDVLVLTSCCISISRRSHHLRGYEYVINIEFKIAYVASQQHRSSGSCLLNCHTVHACQSLQLARNHAIFDPPCAAALSLLDGEAFRMLRYTRPGNSQRRRVLTQRPENNVCFIICRHARRMSLNCC